MADVKWIKITTDIFDNQKIRMIEAMPDGDAIVVIWLKLLMLAGKTNDCGFVYLTKDIPYTEQMLATYFCRPLPTIQLALDTFQRFGMIKIIEDIIYISNWEEYQNVDGLEKIREQTRKRVAKHREAKKIECNGECNVTVTQCNAIDIDIDKDIDKDINKRDIGAEAPTPAKEKPQKHKYGEYKNVLLTDDELEKLKKEYPDYLQRIERLSGYIASKGDKYKSHYATIRNWARRDKEEHKPLPAAAPTEKNKSELKTIEQLMLSKVKRSENV